MPGELRGATAVIDPPARKRRRTISGALLLKYAFARSSDTLRSPPELLLLVLGLSGLLVAVYLGHSYFLLACASGRGLDARSRADRAEIR